MLTCVSNKYSTHIVAIYILKGAFFQQHKEMLGEINIHIISSSMGHHREKDNQGCSQLSMIKLSLRSLFSFLTIATATTTSPWGRPFPYVNSIFLGLAQEDLEFSKGFSLLNWRSIIQNEILKNFFKPSEAHKHNCQWRIFFSQKSKINLSKQKVY